MRQANSIDNPQGSLSDQEVNNNEEDSVEEKQDNEPINEKMDASEGQFQGLQIYWVVSGNFKY